MLTLKSIIFESSTINTISITSYPFFSNCSENCVEENALCSHTPPTDELCASYIERWFYNSEENSCEQIGYSGCNEWGFESLEAL
ncbi:MAG: hypothetical protein EBY39_01325 [Flavobacteriia bacterium]|nr:hypothetical protein [Flavobacteriia bacterium]